VSVSFQPQIKFSSALQSKAEMLPQNKGMTTSFHPFQFTIYNQHDIRRYIISMAEKMFLINNKEANYNNGYTTWRFHDD